jgi:hypothetical protein
MAAKITHLSAHDFLWGHLKDRAYCTKPCTIEKSKERITEKVQAIYEDLRCRVMENLPKRLQECIEKQGGHLPGVIFKIKHY